MFGYSTKMGTKYGGSNRRGETYVQNRILTFGFPIAFSIIEHR